jgi:predicted TIM-barrel enzyme
MTEVVGVFPPKPSALQEVFGTVRVLVGVVHSLPLPGSPRYDHGLAEQTEDAEFFDADVLIATGSRTGGATAFEEVEAISAPTQLPVVIGSGMHGGNAFRLLSVCQGAIVASSLRTNGRWWGRVDPVRVRGFAEQAWRVRYEAP